MNSTIIKELLALILILCFIALFQASMPVMAYTLCYIAALLMFVVFVVSMIKQTDKDEREDAHRMVSSELGFVVGGIVLLLGIAQQTLADHSVDPWLFIGLVAMLTTRIIVRIFLDKKQ